MPDKDTIVAPNIAQGLDDSRADQNQSLQKEAENWLNTPSHAIDLGLPHAPSGEEKPKKEDLFSSLKGLTDQISSTGGKHPKDNIYVSKGDLPDNYTRYDKFYMGANNEDIAGQKQSAGEKLLYGIGRTIGNATKTVVQGITAPLVGLGYLATGGNFIKNDYNDWLESYSKWADKTMPLYETNEEKNSSFLGQIKYGNSWIHLGEFIGMGAGIAGTAWLTGGLGEAGLGEMGIAQGTRITAKYLDAIDKLAESSSVISKLENSEEVGSQLIAKANQIWTQAISEDEKLNQLTNTFEDINKTYGKRITNLGANKQRVYGAASMLGMNAGMGSQANTQFAQSLVDEIKEKEGRDPNPDELDKIQKMSQAVGQWTFGLGTVMSTFSFHGLLKGMIGKDAEKAVLNETTNIVENEGKYSEKKLPFGGAESWLGKGGQWIGNKGYQAGKFASKFVDPWAGVGLTEFSLMGPSVESYYKKKYKTGKADLIEDALGPNIDKLFTKDGMSTFFMGMLGAGPLELGRKLKEGKEQTLNTNTAIGKFNDVTAKTFLNENMNSIIRDKALNTEEQGAIANQDEFTKYNIREQRLINYIFPRIKYGMRNTITKELQEYRNQLTTPEGIKELQKEFNIEGNPDDVKKQLTSYFDHMEDMANKMETNYKAVSMRYGRVPGFKDEHIEKLLYLSQMTDNSTERIKKLAEELQGDPKLQDSYLNTTVNKDQGGFTQYEPTGDITRLLSAESRNTVIREEGEKKVLAHEIYDALHKKIDNLLINDTEKDELRSKLNDLVKLNNTRKQYLKQYHDITHNPGKHSDNRKFSLINPYTEGYDEDTKKALNSVLNPTIDDIETKTGKKNIEIGEEYSAYSPITAIKHDGTETGFRRFKILKELVEDPTKDTHEKAIKRDEGKLKIKMMDGSHAGEILSVDRDFLKNHDVEKTSEQNANGRFASKYGKKFVTLSKDKEYKEKTKDNLEKNQNNIEKDRQIKRNELGIRYKEVENELNNWRKKKNYAEQHGYRPGDSDIDKNIAKLETDLTNLEKEGKGIMSGFDTQQKTVSDKLQELEEKKNDPDYFLSRLSRRDRSAYNTEENKILDKNRITKEEYNKDPKQYHDAYNAIQDLKDVYRKGYEESKKKIKDTINEIGTIQYEPTNDKIKFVNGKGEETEITSEDIKNNVIKRLDGVAWDEEDKNLSSTIADEKIEELLKEKGTSLEKTLDNATKNSYGNEPDKEFYVESEGEKETSQYTANQEIAKVTNKPIGAKGAKKPINIAIRSSVALDSNYLISKYPSLRPWLESRNKWAERANTFLSKMIDPTKLKSWKKSDLKDKNGNYKAPTVLFVHKGNQDQLGLKGFITPEDISRAKQEPIYMVLVHTDENNKKWTLDNNGKKLKEIGSDHSEADYGNMIYTARPGDLTWEDGQKSYQEVKDSEEEKKWIDKFNEETKQIIDSKEPIEHSFKVSNGFFDKPQGGKKRATAISDTGVVDDSGIGTRDIQITTLGGAGIFIGEKEVRVPAGIPYWIRGTAVQVLDAKKFTPKNKGLIFNVLKWISETSLLPDVKGEDPNADRKNRLSSVNEWLSSVSFFNHSFQKEKPDVKDSTLVIDANGFPINRYENQISIGKNRKDGLSYLMLGKKEKILFTPKSLEENKEKIQNFLDTVHHVTLSKELKKAENKGNTTYYEVTGFDDKNIPQTRKWDSYTQYLTSSVDPTGRKREENEIPLTVDTDKAIDGGTSLKGMYLTSYKEGEKKEVVAKPEQKKAEVKQADNKKIVATQLETKKTDTKELGLGSKEPNPIEYTSQVIGDKVNVKITSWNHDTPESIEAISGSIEEYNAKMADWNKATEKLREIIEKKEQTELDTKKAEKPVEEVKETQEQSQEQNVSDIEAKRGDIEKPYREAIALIDSMGTAPLGEINVARINSPASNEAKYQNLMEMLVNLRYRGGDREKIESGLLNLKASDVKHTLQDALERKLKALEQKPEESKPIENPIEVNEKANRAAESAIESLKEGEEEYVPVGKPRKPIVRDMITHEIEKGTPLENIPAFVDWMKKVLPQVDVRDLPAHLEKLAYTWGQYSNDLKTIFLSPNAIEGVGFHEAFHAVFDGFLSPKEQKALLAEFRKNKGTYTDRFGNVREYSKASDSQVMEQMADNFREHNLTNKVYGSEPIKMSFFQRLKNFFRIPTKDINTIFNRINAGYYKNSKSYDTTHPTRNMIRFGDGTKITQQTVRDFSNGVIENIHKYLNIEDGGLAAITEGKIHVDNLLDNIKEDINDKLKQAVFQPKKFKEENPNTSIEQIKDFYRIMSNLSDEKFDEKTGKTYFELNDKKWEYLVKNKIKDKLSGLGLKTIKGTEFINSTENLDSETGESSVPEVLDEVTKNTSKELWGADVFKVNQKDAAPKEIAFLFNTIFQAVQESVPGYNKDLQDPEVQRNSLLFKKVVEDNSLFYQTMHSLSYSGSLQEMDDKMKELAKNVPSLVPTYKYIFGTEASKRTPDQWKFLSRFFKTFSKYAPEPIMHRSDEAGNHFVTAANADSVVTSIQRSWKSNFNGNAKVSTYDAVTKSYKINPKATFTDPTDTKSRFAFLKEIGFTGITQEKYESYIKSTPNSKVENEFSKMVKTIYDGVKKTQSSGGAVLGKDIFGTGKSINKLAEITAELTHDKYASQFQRLDKEFVQTNINQNFYARVVGAVRNALNLEDFMNKNERLKNDVGVKNSVLLKEGSQFFDKDGKPKQVNITIDNGLVDENNNRILLSEMTGPQRMVYTLNGILRGRSEGKGIFQMAAPADQSSDFGMEMEHYIPVTTFKAEGIKVFNHIFKGYLEDEVAMIGDAENRMKYEELAKKVNGTPRAIQLRYFKDILSSELVKQIEDYANLRGEYDPENMPDMAQGIQIPVEAFLKTIEGKFNTDLKIHLQKEIQEHLNYLRKEGVVVLQERNGIPYYKMNGLNTDFLKDFGITRRKFENDPEEFLFTESELKHILEFANMNYKIHNVELSKLFYADPANYKDFLKRAKMYNSGTERNFHSDEANIAYNKDYNKIKVGDNEVDLKEGDYGHRKFTHNMSGMTIDHGDTDKKTTVVSRSWEFLKKHLPTSMFTKYMDTNNPIDAQSYVTMDVKRELGLKAGTWGTKHEELFQLYKAKERLSYDKRISNDDFKKKLGRDYIYSDDSHGKEMKHVDEQVVKELEKKIVNNPDYKGLLNIDKYLGAGYSDEKEFNSPNGLKTSTLTLFAHPEIENSPLEDMYLFMQKHGVDYLGPKSQQKFGRLDKIKPLFNINKDFESTGKLAISDLDPEEVKKQTYQMPLDNYNKIVETAGTHEEGTIGTQLRVQATVDMMNSGLPNDWYNPEDHSFADKKAEWDNMSEEQKRKDSDLYRIHSEMNDCLKGMIKKAEPTVYKTLGIQDGELKHPERLLDYLKKMTNLYNLPANLRDAIRISTDENGKEVINLDQLPNRQSLEYIVNSLIEKHVVRKKMSGGAKIEVSGEGWEKNGRNAIAQNADGTWTTLDTKAKFDKAKTEGQRIQLTSNELKFYREGENGETLGMEIKVGNHFKQKMLAWAEKNGKELPTDEALLKYFEKNPDLLKGVGFRIPSQGLNSFDSFHIVGFTDDALGDAIVVPSELTTKAGSDFDVDKLNTYLKNFYIGEDGFPKKVQFFDKLTEDNLEKIWEQNKAIKEQELQGATKEELIEMLSGSLEGAETRTVKELKEEIKKLADIEDSTQNELNSLNDFIKKYKDSKDPYEVNHANAIDNKYYELLHDSILHESNIEKLLTPNSTDFLEEVEAEMSKIEGKDDVAREKGDINYSNFLNMNWINQRRQEVLEAKNATSISANGVTSHAMMQTFPYHLNPDINIKLPHQKIVVNYKGEKREVTSLANIKNRVGQHISEVLSQIVNTTVDAVNNPILMRLLPSIDVFSQSLFLIRSGVDPMHTFFFLKQPIIQEYIKEKNKNKNRSEDGKFATKRLSNEKIKDKILDQFKGGDEAVIDQFELSNDKGTGLKDMLGAYSKNEKLSDTRKAVQRAILKEFLAYTDLSTELFEQQNGSYWGNVRKTTDNNVFLKNRTYNKAEQNPNFIGLHDNMDNSWFGTMKNTVTKLSNTLNSVLFKLTDPIAEKQTRSAREYVADLIIKGGADEKNSLLNKIKSNFMDFLVQTHAKDAKGKYLNEEISRLALGDRSLANQLMEIKAKIDKIRETDPNSDIANNPALKKLTALISNPKNPRMIGLEGKPNGVNESEDFTSALDELKDHADFAEFYEDLNKLNILQSGTGPNRNSISSLIPHEDFERYTNQGIQAIKDNSPMLKAYDKLKIFWRTNFNDDRIVQKRYKTEKYILDNGEKVVHLPTTTKAGKPYKYSPVVKIKRPIDITVEENGKQIIREATPEELAKMRNNNEDFKENLWQTEGYQQVTHPNGEPIVVEVEIKGKKEERFLYKPINLWGDGRNMGEFYTEPRPSVLDKNIKVNEMSDEEFLDMYNNDQKGLTIVDYAPKEGVSENEPQSIINEEQEPEYGYDDVSEGEAMPDTEEEWAAYHAKNTKVFDEENEENHDIGNGGSVKPLVSGDEADKCPF